MSDMVRRRSTKPVPKARGPREDGAQTRARLLEAAGVVFAEKGFDRATAKEITGRAGSNGAAVNYYFGGIEGLYQEVLIAAHNRIVSLQELRAIVHGSLGPQDKLRQLIALIAGIVCGPASASWAIRILSREILAPTPHFDVLRRKALEPKKSLVFALVADLLELPKDHPAVARCFLNIVAPSFMLLLADRRVIANMLPSVGNGGAKALEMHLERFALGGIAAIAEAERLRRPRGSRNGKQAARPHVSAGLSRKTCLA